MASLYGDYNAPVATITAIKPTQRDPDRVSVHVDGKFTAAISVRSAADLGLAVGRACDAGLLERLQRTAAVDKAVRQSLTRLGRRMLSRGQLDRKLKDSGYDEPTRAAALDRLTDVGLLDDRAFAEALVHDLRRRRPAGPNLLRQKLYEKFVPRPVIDAVLAELADPQSDADAAAQLARQRADQLQHVDPVARRRRIWALLARRGFDPHTIRDAMDTLRDPPTD